MSRRTFTLAFTLVELLVVVAILAVLAAILFPVFAQARAKAQQASCQSNLRQIGMAIALYRSDFDDVNPRHRLCPDNPDPDACTRPASTGPSETWWAPYDGTVPNDAPGPYAQFKPGFLYPYVRDQRLFKCPADPERQVGYAMSQVHAGPTGKPDSSVDNPSAFFVWEHLLGPACSDNGGVPVPPSGDTEHLHYPHRHNDGLVFLRYDNSVKWHRPSSLTTDLFSAEPL